MGGTIYEQGLGQHSANFVALTPLSFIRRTADVYPQRVAVIQGSRQLTWGESYDRCTRLASALQGRDVGSGDTVAVIASNCVEMFEAHFAVAMAGAVLNAINTRLDAPAIRFMLEHGEAKVFMVDKEFGVLAREVVSDMAEAPLIISIDDADYDDGELFGELSYDDLLDEASADAEHAWQMPDDEWQAIALNYTSGTTGDPKGVVFHHRGAYLNAISNGITWNMSMHPTYLWTLPMFHCNGWCFPWTLAIYAGTSVCLRHVRAEPIFDAIREHRVSHFCGAPIVLNTLLSAPAAVQQGIEQQVNVMTAGAAPPAAVIEGMERLGFDVTHVYGLTETYGPVTLCAWQSEQWDELPVEERAVIKAKQGVRAQMLEGLMVADPETLEPVPMDGQTMGEVFMRGNNVMKGYLKNAASTDACFDGGWFHSGDLAVWHPDGYIQVKDRSKDIIISGGENISSIEVEDVLYRHPDIMEAAVVARSDEKWGETPCAFVEPHPGRELSDAAVISYCRDNMAHFKAPKHVVFGPLPKTSTGKIQKYKLREIAEKL